MSFTLHAAGTGGFRMQRANNADDDVFQAGEVLSAVMSSGPSLGGVARGVADYANPVDDPTDVMRNASRFHTTNMLRNEVTYLANRGGSGGGNAWIAVTTICPRLWPWPDSTTFVNWRMEPEDDAGSRFIRALVPSLETTGFNHFGTFLALYRVVSAYGDHIPDNHVPMLNITLRK